MCLVSPNMCVSSRRLKASAVVQNIHLRRLCRLNQDSVKLLFGLCGKITAPLYLLTKCFVASGSVASLSNW